MDDDRDPSATAGGRKKWSIEDEAAASNHELVADLPPGDAKVHDLTSHYRRSMAAPSPIKGVNSATVGATPSGAMPPQFPFSVHAYDITGGSNANRAPNAPPGAAPRSHRATVAFTPSQVNAAKNREFTASLSASATFPLPNVNLETTSGSGTKPQQSLHGSPYVTAVLLSLWDFSSGPRPEQVWIADPSGLKNSNSPASTASNTSAIREDWQPNQVVDLADSTPLVHPTPAAPYHIHITDHQFLGPKPSQDGITSQSKSDSDPSTLLVPSGDQDASSSGPTILRSTSPTSSSHTSQRDTNSSLEGIISVPSSSTLPLTVADHENLRGSLPLSGTISPPLPNTIPIIAPSTKVTKLMGGRRGAASDLDLAGSFGFDADEEDESPIISEIIDEDYVAKKNPPLKKALLAARLKNAPRVVSSHPKHAKTNRFASATTDSLDFPSSPKAETLDTNVLSESTDSHHAQDSGSQNQNDGHLDLEHVGEGDVDVRDRENEKRSSSISSLGSLNASRRRSYSLTGDSSSRTTVRSKDVLNELDGDEDSFEDHPAHSDDDDSDSDSSLYSSSSSDAWDEDGEDGSDDGSSSSEASDHGPSTEESAFLSGDIMAIAAHVAKYTLGSDLAELVSSSSMSSPSPSAGGGIMMDPWNITSNNQNGHGDSNTPAGDGTSHPVGSTLSNVFGGSDDGDFGFFGERNASSTGGGGNTAQKRDGSGNGNASDRNGGGGAQSGMGGGDPSDPNNDPNSSSNMGAKMATGEDDNDAVNFLGIEHKLHVFESAPYFTLSAVFTAPYNVKITGPTNTNGASAAPGIASFVEGPMAGGNAGNNAGAPTFAADPTKFAFSLLLPKEVYETFTRHYAALIDRLNQWVVLYVYLCQLRPQQALPLIHKEVVRTVMQMNRLLGCEGISLPSLKNTLFALARPNSHDSTPGSFNSSTATTHGLNASTSAIHSSHGAGNHPHSNAYGRDAGVGSVDSRQGGFSPFSPPSSPMHSHPSHALPSQLNYMHADFMSGDESSLSVGTGPSLGQSFSPSPFSLDGPLTSPNSSFGDMPHFYGEGSTPSAALSDRQYRISTSITSANSPHLGMSQHAPLSPRGATPREFELPGHGALSASSPAVPSGGAAPIPINVGERSGSANTYGKENVSSSTSWIDEPKKVREFLALILTSHFQTHQRTVILGEDLDMVNLFVSTLAVFLSAEDRYVSTTFQPFSPSIPMPFCHILTKPFIFAFHLCF